MLRNNLIRTEPPWFVRTSVASQVVVSQEASKIVHFQPVIEVNLVEVGGHDLLGQCVGLGAKKRYSRAGQDSNQCLQDAIGINA